MTLAEGLSREYLFLRSIGRTFYRMRRVKPDARYTISDIVEEFARLKPFNVAILYEDRLLTYRDLAEGANRYARWAIEQGVKKGDVVSLLMSNRPEYLMAWLGIVKIGGIVALLNTNMRGSSLAHCINIAGARHLVVGNELYEAYWRAHECIDAPPVPWVTGGYVAGSEDLDAALDAVSGASLDPAYRAELRTRDTAFYIYTSGTTGLPKAANFSHMRMLFMMFGFAGALGAREGDRMYDALPLYHSTGGVCAVGVALTTGGSLVLRPKFSAQEFWKDCHRYRPTYFQYIGELCRYLLNAPRSPLDCDHGVQAITGNGLRPDIWTAFQKRFKIPKIIEFYGATEGNVGMINYDGKVGAVGRVPRYMRAIAGTRIVKFDVEAELPLRDAGGFCIECGPDEIGEAIGKVRNEPGRNFEGYTRSSETSKKILRDVFEVGDVWFRTGDLMRRDRHGYFYFVDRIGDTFRWKGENVATSEVAEALGAVRGVLEANVYGVAVPNCDGRAGMAALVADSTFEVSGLAETLARSLAGYARPLFLRLQAQIAVTGTFKQRKVDLVRDGFDPTEISDALYWLNAETGRYEGLDTSRYADIVAGRVRL
jgi:fatty-acyl-CoA synthase